MNRLLILTLFWLLFFSCCYAQPQPKDSIDWGKIHTAMRRGQYQEACSLYQDVFYNHSVAEYRRLNSMKVEDLSKEYSIEDLKLRNHEQRNRLLSFVYVSGIALLLVIALLILIVWNNNRRIVLSRKRIEEAKAFAEESVHNKSLLLSNMSHEIRTPLNAISGFADVLLMEGLDEDTRKQSNEVIRMNSELLQKLINDIVSISCVDDTHMAFNIQPCEVVSVGRNIVKTINAIKRTEAEILFLSDFEELVIETDSSRLQQLLINLLVNATKFTKRGSITLKIEQGAAAGFVQLSVSDTGCGIPLESQSRIFNRYEKLNEQVQGSGIGLSICQLIIHRLGGEIWIDPTYTEGAKFVFTHPLRQKGGEA